MNRSQGWLIAGLVSLTLLAVGLHEALARAGGGRSSGSRGSRSFSSPARPAAPLQSAPAPGSSQFRQQAPAPAPIPQPAPAAGGFWRSLAGGIAGGFLGAMLFRGLAGAGGLGGGLGGGIGLFEILLLAGAAYFIYWIIKRGRQAEAAPAGAYHREAATADAEPAYLPAAGPAVAEGSGEDLARGLGYIRQMDPGFDEARFKDQAMDAFFRVQGAWMNRDLAPVRALLTEEIALEFQKELDEQKRQGQINRLENIAVRSVDLTEAWQERGQDYASVRFYANLLDYTVDERTGQVASGSRTDPVKFEEYWTFTRPVGPHPWKLSAINQAG
jgi:predicted lipid-binding transport protein (Tim44 family)